MQMTISGHHLTVTDPIRNYVTTKLLKLERRYELITKIAVTLTVDKLVQKAEATVHARGAEIFANSEHEDLYAAITPAKRNIWMMTFFFSKGAKTIHKIKGSNKIIKFKTSTNLIAIAR